MTPTKLTVVIPTYNEEEIISFCLTEIAKALPNELSQETEIIVADDGIDNLPAIVESCKKSLPFQSVSVMRNTPGVGKGQALVLAFQKAKGNVVGFLDVDLSTPPSYINSAYSMISKGETEAFIGSRRTHGSKVERQQFFLKDILGNALGVLARKIIFSNMRNFTDTQCGFKFYKNEIAKKLYCDLIAPDGLNDLEILIKANLCGVKVHEQGVVWKDIRESKRSLRRILLGEMRAIFKILFVYKIMGGRQKKLLNYKSHQTI